MGSIQVVGINKAYKHYATRFDRMIEWITCRNRHTLKWVIQDLNFNVAPGEAVGIIGINGAGKSTLLKIITGTTTPTSGYVHMTGRVAAMLELGMGFHPDFTGRQNVHMAAQLLGYTTDEIAQYMPFIEEFAEIGEAIDEPIRVYSSGMQMRLAFGVATAKRPDILIIDEALSVGDAYFQHKSFDRIRQFQKQGTTLLFVSHDKQAIQSVCDRAILLDGGKVVQEGAPDVVMDYYNALIAHREAPQQIETNNQRVQTISGTGEASIEEVVLINQKGQSVDYIDVGEPVTLKVTACVHSVIPKLVFGYAIKDRLGQVMFGTNTHLKKQIISDLNPGEKIECFFSFPASFGPGCYSVSLALTSTETHLVNNYEWRDLALVFNVVNMMREHFSGCVWLEPEIQINRMETK